MQTLDSIAEKANEKGQNRPPSSAPQPRLDLDVGELPIRLRQTDFARLIGVTKQRVSQMIASGWIETTPGGKIDPSAAVAALLRRDHEGHALKALPQIRTRLAEAESIREDALATVRQMEQARDHANKARLAAEREQSRLARVALELELALELMRPTAGDDPVDQAIERAMRTSLERMSEAMLDPDLLAKAAAAEPTVEQRIDALALRVEQAEAANDPRIDRFRADLFLAQFRAQPTAEVEDDV